jgi:hypothetical protein
MVTRQEAQDRLATATAERDTIQGNLLDLDTSFGKRMLSGAQLTGVTKQRWDAASAALASLWDTYTAYSAVIDRATELLATVRDRDMAQVTDLLLGRSVRLARGPAPLASRDLADTGLEDLTIATAVARMRKDFPVVTEVVTAAEAVWGEVGALLDQAGAELTRATALTAGIGDDALSAALATASAQLSAQRTTLNSDPLALWHGGGADTSAAGRAREQVAKVVAQAEALARLRAGARERIDALAATAAIVSAARDEAVTAWRRAAEKVAAGFLPAEPPPAADFGRAGLDALAASGEWRLLSDEVDRVERELAAALTRYRAAAAAAEGVLGRRDELRGLLQAYKAKAARLGGAEDLVLTQRYDQARDLLWTAPCDLGTAAEAVAAYQQAILAIGRGQR